MEKIINQLKEKIQELASHKTTVIVAIDGRCASGKSTLGAKLQNELCCNLFHMDDFFLQPHQVTEERLSKAGENVDYERVLQEVILPIKSGKPFEYFPYNCKTQALKSGVKVEPTLINIIEGSYSHHLALRKYYDLTVFLSVDPETQLERIIARNGEAVAEIFKNKWIILEEKYFLQLNVRENSDISFDSLD